MTVFQFDKCFDDKRVIEACNQEGKATAYRLPRGLRDAKDPELLAALLPRGNPIVTIDSVFAEDNIEYIPDNNPGIVVVCYSKEVINKVLTTSVAAKLLKGFKDAVPAWEQLPLNNSVVIVTERSVDVFHVQSSHLVPDAQVVFEEEEAWAEKVVRAIQANSGGGGTIANQP